MTELKENQWVNITKCESRPDAVGCLMVTGTIGDGKEPVFRGCIENGIMVIPREYCEYEAPEREIGVYCSHLSRALKYSPSYDFLPHDRLRRFMCRDGFVIVLMSEMNKRNENNGNTAVTCSVVAMSTPDPMFDSRTNTRVHPLLRHYSFIPIPEVAQCLINHGGVEIIDFLNHEELYGHLYAKSDDKGVRIA